ncbi:membrane integrity-associated transporter subunit PqiC [Sulfitobacter sp. 20_GPM-1509m]|uniref:PqiC family protein n=1 Tax=Sulfitobacter sp. 20_GPM-1509m TaxID=1380367 RepID=UPI000B080756|nr:ABC-type transport auxiliary lipoprotein family protein [Sulfitobacter sp. 20_GPM-1509m]|tara:strand:- start:402 stop:971 length:570 start_codon:yes stop_codon:yes gene_type:complete
MKMINTGSMAALGLVTLIAACGSTEVRVASPVSAPETRVRSSFSSLEVSEVTLPSYAAAEDIYMRAADGTISPMGTLWADLPARSITLQLSRDLGAITGVTVAPEPWPFRAYAAAKVDVRIEEMLATAEGVFRLSGQYFIAPEAGGRASAGSFAIEEPIVGDTGSPTAIAAARGQAVGRLAETIARKGL